jgi:hypothetical protein
MDVGLIQRRYRSLHESITIIALPLSEAIHTHFTRTCSTTLSDLSLRRRDRREQETFMDEGDRELYLEEQAEEDEVLEEMGNCVPAVGFVMGPERIMGDLREVRDMIKRVKKEGLRLRAGEGGRI